LKVATEASRSTLKPKPELKLKHPFNAQRRPSLSWFGESETRLILPTAFVASSSEALDVVAPVRTLLRRAIGGTAEVRPWSEEFQLTRTYIESLECLLDRSDFAVLVLTPVDRTESRDTERLSPRDNVVFELEGRPLVKQAASEPPRRRATGRVA
jgi:predicted nucleotide-binding protein